MSRVPPEKYVILQTARFHELCGFLNLKGQCCSDPDKKIIERAFRKKALKTHPDKGGDPVEFKKINDAYNRLMGHITKLEITNEETDIACNSIIIEISKIAVPKWRDKLKKCYGVPKCDNVKNLVFEGPYEQYRGRSNHTGPITVLLYIDPQDFIPKLHIQAEKYMAWITEQRMPMHLHVDKAKQIQFDQWRICHPAEFGLSSFGSNVHMAPPPTPTPKPKRKAREKNTEPKPKSRRDSTPKQTEEATKHKQEATNSNSEPKKSDSSGSNVVPDSGNPEEINGDWEEVIESPNDPNLNNMANEIVVKDGKRYRKKSANAPKPQEAKSFENKPFTCGQCGTGYLDCGDYSKHRQMCVPDEEFNEEMRDYFKQQEPPKEDSKTHADNSKMDTNVDSLKSNSDKTLNEVPLKSLSPIREEVSKPVTAPSVPPALTCNNCNSIYSSEVTLKRHSYVCKSTKSTKSKLKQKGSVETDTKLSDASCNGSAKGTQNTYEHEKVENNNVKKDKTAMDCNDMYEMLDKINEGIQDDNKSDKTNTKPSSKEQSSHQSKITDTHKPCDTHINIPNKIQSTDNINQPNDISAQKQENITVSKQSRNLNGCEPPSANPVYSHSKQIKMTASDSLTPKTAKSDIVVTNVELKQSNLQKDQTPSAKLGQKLTNGNSAHKIKSEVNGNCADSKKSCTSREPRVDAQLNKPNKPWRQSNPQISKFNVEKNNISTNNTEKIPDKNKSTSDKNKITVTKEKKLDELEIISQTCNKVTAPVESKDDKVKIVLKDKEEKMQIDVSQANDKKTKLGKGDHQNKEGKLLAEKMEIDEPQTAPSKDDKMVKSLAQATPTTLYSKTSEIQMASRTTGGQENKDSSDLQLNIASSISQTSKDKVNITCSTVTATTTTANTNFSSKDALRNTTITSIGLPDSPPFSVPSGNKSTATNNISTPINMGLSQSTKQTKPTTTLNSNNTDNEKNWINVSENKEKLSTLTTGSKINNSHQVNGLESNTTKNSSTSGPENSSVSAKQSPSNPSLQINGTSQTNKTKTSPTSTKITSARGTQLKTSSSANQNIKDSTGAQLKTPSSANENIKDKPADSAEKTKVEAKIPDKNITAKDSFAGSKTEKETETKKEAFNDVNHISDESLKDKNWTPKGFSSMSSTPVLGKYSLAPKSAKQLDKKALDVSNDILSSKPEETMDKPSIDAAILSIKSINHTPLNSPKTAKHLDKKAIDVSNIIFKNKDSMEASTTTVNTAPIITKCILKNAEPDDKQKQTPSNRLIPSTSSSKLQSIEPESNPKIIEAKQCYIVNVPIKDSNPAEQKASRENINPSQTNNVAKNITAKGDTNDVKRLIDPGLNKNVCTQAKTLHATMNKKEEEILPSNIMWNKQPFTPATVECAKGNSTVERQKINSSSSNSVKLTNSTLDDRQKPGPEATNSASKRPVNCGLSRFEVDETRTSASNVQPRTSQYASQWANTASSDPPSGKSMSEVTAMNMTTNYMKQHHHQPTKLENTREHQSSPAKSYSITPIVTNSAPKPYTPSSFSTASYSKSYATSTPATTSTSSYKSEPFTPALSRKTVYLAGHSNTEDIEPILRSKAIADNMSNNLSKLGGNPLSGSKSNVHFSEPAITASHRYPSNSATHQNHSSHVQFTNPPISPPASSSLLTSSSIKSTHSAYQSTPSKYKGSMSNSANLTSLPAPSSYQADHSRAKSEGGGLTSNTSSMSRGTSDLFKEIQQTKDRHRENFEQAMKYTTPLPPRTPMLSHKFPRPEPTTTYKSSTLDRREKKDKQIIDKLLMDRQHRAKSDGISKISCLTGRK